jgi:hypothetical protein
VEGLEKGKSISAEAFKLVSDDLAVADEDAFRNIK